MESSKRSSFDEFSIRGSTLRKLARSPASQRFSLRGSGTSSTSSASVKSFESETPTSCVTRETPSDECALHRFIVWAAVKRNACTKMTPEERRECPLLRCRKRFPNHELMLQHLYSCEHLVSGDYWCYDCGKVEKLHDVKCRRCLGHPSRRRKLLSLAKSVLSSLGRPKIAALPTLHVDIDDETHTYHSVLETTQQFELQANEIHEIDSGEMLLPTIPEIANEGNGSVDFHRPASTFSTNYDHLLSDQLQRPVESTSDALIDESLINWEPSPELSTLSPAQLLMPATCKISAKPALHVDTSVFDYYRSRSRRRSKNLQPSTSVRSTSSTNSTNSTNSTSTTASCTISPMSAWSGAWGHDHRINSTLTSPADDVPCLDDSFPCVNALSPCVEVDDTSLIDDQIIRYKGEFEGISELPADVPVNATNIDCGQSLECFDPMMNIMPSIADTTLHDGIDALAQEPQLLLQSLKHENKSLDASKLVRSAQETLKVHLLESMKKIKQLAQDGHNPLVAQFHDMETDSVATAGLQTMLEILNGHEVTSSVKLLSFVHIVYSLSLALHAQEAPHWLNDLFLQAMSYTYWLPYQDRLAYVQVVNALWGPDDLTDEGFMDLLRKSLAPRTDGNKGKRPTHQSNCETDPMIFISQYFLDELEYASLLETKRPSIQASTLCLQHLTDANQGLLPNFPFALLAKSLIASLSQRYHRIAGFVASMNDLLHKVGSNHISTTRRFELELMQAGKMQLPPDVYFDGYVREIRTHINSIHTRGSHQVPKREIYYNLGIELMGSIMHGNDLNLNDLAVNNSHVIAADSDAAQQTTTELDWLNPELMDSFGLETSADETVSKHHVTAEALLAEQQSILSSPMVLTSFAAPPETSATPSSSTQTAEPTLSAEKREADVCCEICGYRPKGDPKWFHGSMAKHKRLQHASSPPKIYPCPYPGCNSQYKNRPDNLRQHQIEKGHFMDGQDESIRDRKRRRIG